jgi:peptide/nickel transport system substrate-binding protein
MTVVTSLFLVLVLLAGCRGGGGGRSGAAPTTAPPGASEGKNDIGATGREGLADGGTLRWPISQIPPNFNANELDGSLGDNVSVIGALMPSMFDFDAAAQPVLKQDYATSADLKATTPKQIVTFRLNPKATWDDGTPVTEADFEAQWKALNGTAAGFKVVSTVGYDKIESVVAGADEREVVVTFKAPYADWRGLFSPLYPASTNRDAAVFNDGWKDKPLTTAGPFRVGGVDPTAKTITLVRNDRWWGRRAKLDRIILQAIDQDAQIDALANGEIDFAGTGSDVNKVRRAQSLKGVVLRRASAPNFNHVTLNGSSEILKDLDVRRALAMAIDRATIAKALLGPLGVPPTALGNHILMSNQKGYRDNSGDLAFDPARARSLLDQAGWKLNGKVRTPGRGGVSPRVKDGRPLTLRLVLPASSTIGKQIAQLMLGMAADVGITIDLVTVPGDQFFEKYVTPGNFDLVLFSWGGTVFPISGAKSIYAKPKPGADGELKIQQNYARIGSDELDRLFDEATAIFDADRALELANRIDKAIWDEVHSLPFYQLPGTVAVNERLANFGAFGFASVLYEDIGFRKP